MAFHAQQRGEKYLKAYLVLQCIDFPKTHHLGEMIALAGPGLDVGLTAEEHRRLTDYATITRYPGDYEPVSIVEARKAVTFARRVRSAVRKQMPKETLGRRKR